MGRANIIWEMCYNICDPREPTLWNWLHPFPVQGL